MTHDAQPPSKSQRKRFRESTLTSVLAVGLMVTASPIAPALASDAAAQSDFKVGRIDGTDTVYDISVPKRFGEMLTCTGEFAADAKKYCDESTETVNGVEVTTVRTVISSDKAMYSHDAIAYGRFGQKWHNFDKEDRQAWAEIDKLLQERAEPWKDGWWSSEFETLKAPVPSDSPVRVPIPEGLLAQMAMRDIAQETVRGAFYDAQVPKDIEAYRQQMLAYSNAGRANPNFRVEHGSKTVTDLSLDKVQMLNRTWLPVYRENDTPPYFSPQYLTPELNNAAQLQAEWDAFDSNHPAHTGPRSYKGADGKTVDLYSLDARGDYFNAPNIVEGAAGGAPSETPLIWMKSDTHFKPFFNVEAYYPALGYGAAQDKKGNWHFVFVAQQTKDQPPLKIDAVTLPITGTTGIVGPTGDDGKVTVTLAQESGDADADASDSTDAPSDDAGQGAEQSAQVSPALTAACEGFADYLRREVGSGDATLQSVVAEGAGAKCTVATPDLSLAELSIAPATGDDEAVCAYISEGRTTNDVEQLGDAVKSTDPSGSDGKSFKFIEVNTPAKDGVDQQARALSCTAGHEFRGRLDYQPGDLNPLLSVNATAEAMRRLEAAN